MCDTCGCGDYYYGSPPPQPLPNISDDGTISRLPPPRFEFGSYDPDNGHVLSYRSNADRAIDSELWNQGQDMSMLLDDFVRYTLKSNVPLTYIQQKTLEYFDAMIALLDAALDKNANLR